jgi:serine/threonine protein phosphatase PrpC
MPVDEPWIVAGQDEFVQDGIRLAGGEVSIHTRRDPTRQSVNQDAIGIFDLGATSGLIVLADGAGGLPAGGEAARLAIEQIARFVRKPDQNEGSLRAPILDGIESANRAVLERRNGSATTLEVVEIQEDQLRCYHIGDSDTLLVGGRGKIKFQTVSQSPVGYAVESGLVDPEEALFHEDLNVVSNLLGTQEMKIEIGPTVALARRDTVLVASDGLTDNLRTEELICVIRKGPLRSAREHLDRLAIARMQSTMPEVPSKPDDLSFVLFRRRSRRRPTP